MKDKNNKRIIPKTKLPDHRKVKGSNPKLPTSDIPPPPPPKKNN